MGKVLYIKDFIKKNTSEDDWWDDLFQFVDLDEIEDLSEDDDIKL